MRSLSERPNRSSFHTTPEQVKHGLILHDFRRCHQRRKDHALLSPINDVVGLIAKMNRSPCMSHGSCIGISGADPLIRATLIEASHLALLLSSFCIPIVARSLFLQERFLRFFR